MQQWKVTAVDSYMKPIGKCVFVRASTNARARAVGWLALRNFVRGRNFRVLASPYDPTTDPVMRGYVRKIGD